MNRDFTSSKNARPAILDTSHANTVRTRRSIRFVETGIVAGRAGVSSRKPRPSVVGETDSKGAWSTRYGRGQGTRRAAHSPSRTLTPRGEHADIPKISVVVCGSSA